MKAQKPWEAGMMAIRLKGYDASDIYEMSNFTVDLSEIDNEYTDELLEEAVFEANKIIVNMIKWRLT